MLQTASSCSVNCYCSIPNREDARNEERRAVEREEWREAERRRGITELKEWREELRRVEERRAVEREEWREELRRVEERRAVERE